MNVRIDKHWNLVDDYVYKCPRCPNAYIHPENLIKHMQEEGHKE